MAVFHRPTNPEQRERRLQAEAAQSAALIVFQRMAEGGELDDATISAHAVLFDVWDKAQPLTAGCIRRCPESGELFRNTKLPDPRTRSEPKPPSKALEQWAVVDSGLETFALVAETGGKKVSK